MLKILQFVDKVSNFDDIEASEVEQQTPQNKVSIKAIQEAKKQAKIILDCGFETFHPTVKSQVFN